MPEITRTRTASNPRPLRARRCFPNYLQRRVHERKLIRTALEESRISNHVRTSGRPHERDGRPARDRTSLIRKSTSGTRNKVVKQTRRDRGEEEDEREREKPTLPRGRVRLFFSFAFPRVANRVKANVPETKLDPADPAQLEFRFARKPPASPSSLPPRKLPVSLCFSPRSTPLNSSTTFLTFPVRGIRPSFQYLLNSANTAMVARCSPMYRRGARRKFQMKRFPDARSRVSHLPVAFALTSRRSGNCVQWKRDSSELTFFLPSQRPNFPRTAHTRINHLLPSLSLSVEDALFI